MLLLLLLSCTKASQMFGRTNNHEVRMMMMVTVTSVAVQDTPNGDLDVGSSS
jgi:hypothetical protein